MNIENQVVLESTEEVNDGRIRIPLVGYLLILLPFLVAIPSLMGK